MALNMYPSRYNYDLNDIFLNRATLDVTVIGERRQCSCRSWSKRYSCVQCPFLSLV
jgi:hypothetical protein